jgi:hypothetical protein
MMKMEQIKQTTLIVTKSHNIVRILEKEEGLTSNLLKLIKNNTYNQL